MQGGLNGPPIINHSLFYRGSTRKSCDGEETVVHCNFLINKSVHNRMKTWHRQKYVLKDIVNEAMKELLDKQKE
jgi:hypothetical protein